MIGDSRAHIPEMNWGSVTEYNCLIVAADAAAFVVYYEKVFTAVM